jgi:fatty-acyl-CoA synthase
LRLTATITTSAGLPLAWRRSANVRRREGAQATAEELRAFLAPRFARFWLPDAFVFTDQIPRTAAGKLLKAALREQYKTYQLQPA